MFPCCPQLIGIDSHSDLAHWYDSTSISMEFLLSMFCHLIIEMFPSPEKLSVDDILCELRKKFKYNAAFQIHSWDVFAAAATMVSWAAHTGTCLKAFYVHMPKCIFQEMCDVLILSSLCLYKLAWFISHLLSNCFAYRRHSRLLVPEMTTEVWE